MINNSNNTKNLVIIGLISCIFGVGIGGIGGYFYARTSLNSWHKCPVGIPFNTEELNKEENDLDINQNKSVNSSVKENNNISFNKLNKNVNQLDNNSNIDKEKRSINNNLSNVNPDNNRNNNDTISMNGKKNNNAYNNVNKQKNRNSNKQGKKQRNKQGNKQSKNGNGGYMQKNEPPLPDFAGTRIVPPIK